MSALRSSADHKGGNDFLAGNCLSLGTLINFDLHRILSPCCSVGESDRREWGGGGC